MQRIHSLGKKTKTDKTAKEFFKECILYLKKDYQSFEFNYNRDFFKSKYGSQFKNAIREGGVKTERKKIKVVKNKTRKEKR